MISLLNVTKNYSLDEKNHITPVHNISLNIDKGELIIIIGRSGSGKTTLLNLTAGLVKPTKGRILIGNTDLSQMTDNQLSILRSRTIGFIFQFPSLLPTLTVIENVILSSIFVPRNKQKDIHERAKTMIEKMGLKEKCNVFPKILSSGEQKRVVIARSLINNPQIILADEPTSDLDVQTEREVMSILKSTHVKGVTIFMVTHNLQLIPYASRAFRMEDGILNEITYTSENTKSDS